jgi:hypothetical protein
MIFTLKKDAWHAKLMKYIWNLDHTDFTHMCPYFWLSIANFFIFSWVVFIITNIVKMFSYTGKAIRRYRGKRTTKQKEIRQLARDLTEEEARKKIEEMKSNPILAQTMAERFAKSEYGLFKLSSIDSMVYQIFYYSYKFVNEEFNKLLEEYRKKALQLYQETELAKSNVKKVRVERVNNLVKLSKPIAVGIIIIAAILTLIGALYGVYRLTILVVDLPALFWSDFRWWLGFVIFCIGMLILVIWIVVLLIEFIKSINFAINMNFKWVKYIALFAEFIFEKSWIAKGLSWFFKGAGFFFTVLFQMFKNNCPPIKWN